MTRAAPSYTREHVDNCAFHAWYPRLQHVAITGVVVPLPPAFVSLLLADGVRVPSSHASDQCENDADATAIAAVRSDVEAALKKLKGAAFPKLNWSAPSDASWMLGGSLRCTTYEDVFLLLKASDFVVHDLTQPYAGAEPAADSVDASDRPSTVTLVLKKWCSLYDSMLFRCFVVEHRLVAVCQRHCDEYYDFLEAQQDALAERIYDFYHRTFRGAANAFPDRDFVLDVYVDKEQRVHLVDINVFGGVTDPLLFTWEELLEWRDEWRAKRSACADQDEEQDDEDATVEFRVVESQKGIRPNPLSSYRTPTDFVDHLAVHGGFDAFIDQVRRDNAESSDEEDEQEADEDDDDVVWGSDNDDYD
ncbi:hypothetical protein P43SY_009865 [Pythium insidiosum]|uniref:Cell division cycle protein 123 n=1 Tax=Pythium insidiosum TaxID=114742 RepID=A0AAD5M7C5_PYTIN|nr:hypothetical protein P43SY_009865 [Pythium insidiosum]